jgi:hypothetical protein
MCVKWASSTWQTDTVNAATKQKGKEEGGEGKSEIRTAMKRGLNSSQKTSSHYEAFLKITSVL